LEKPNLTVLSRILPPVYAGRAGGECARKHAAEIVIYRRGAEIARHRRRIGQRDARSTLPGHHPTSTRADRGPALEEQLLRGDHPSLERYAAALKQRSARRPRP